MFEWENCAEFKNDIPANILSYTIILFIVSTAGTACVVYMLHGSIYGEHVLEEVAAKMLNEIKLPLFAIATTSLGSLRELRLPSFDERTSLPLTITECINLLRSIGRYVCMYVCTVHMCSMCVCVLCVYDMHCVCIYVCNVVYLCVYVYCMDDHIGLISHRVAIVYLLEQAYVFCITMYV